MVALVQDMNFLMAVDDPPFICADCGEQVHAGTAAVAYRFFATDTSLILHDSCAFRVVAGLARDLTEVSKGSEVFVFRDGPDKYQRKRLEYLKECYEELKSSMYLMVYDPECEEEDEPTTL